MLSLVVLLLFLAVQRRIDEDDPKLAWAPLTRSRYLLFPEFPENQNFIDSEDPHVEH